MKLRNIVWIAALLGLTSTAFGGEEMHTRMKIAVVEGDTAAETRIVLDSDELGFDLHDMQVGENQAFVDASGRNILITREDDGFSFNVDGKTIKLPGLDGDHDAHTDVDVQVQHGHSDAHEGHEVKIIKKKIEIKSDSPEA